MFVWIPCIPTVKPALWSAMQPALTGLSQRIVLISDSSAGHCEVAQSLNGTKDIIVHATFPLTRLRGSVSFLFSMDRLRPLSNYFIYLSTQVILKLVGLSDLLQCFHQIYIYRLIMNDNTDSTAKKA